MVVWWYGGMVVRWYGMIWYDKIRLQCSRVEFGGLGVWGFGVCGLWIVVCEGDGLDGVRGGVVGQRP